MGKAAMDQAGVTPRPAPGVTGPVLLVVAGGAVSQAAIARTAELAAGAPVTVLGLGSTEISRTDACSSAPRPAHPAGEARQRVSPSRPGRARAGGGTEPEQVRRTVALAMSILEDTGVMATGHVAVTSSPARAVARLARTCGARVVILDQSGPSAGGPSAHSGASWAGEAGSGSRGGAGTAGLMADLRRRMYGSGLVVLTETAKRGGWLSA
jgi:hypothetical protein